jgi:hypothetical protein
LQLLLLLLMMIEDLTQLLQYLAATALLLAQFLQVAVEVLTGPELVPCRALLLLLLLPKACAGDS